MTMFFNNSKFRVTVCKMIKNFFSFNFTSSTCIWTDLQMSLDIPYKMVHIRLQYAWIFPASFGDCVPDMLRSAATQKSISRFDIATQYNETEEAAAPGRVLRGSREALLYSAHKHVLRLRSNPCNRTRHWHHVFCGHRTRLHFVWNTEVRIVMKLHKSNCNGIASLSSVLHVTKTCYNMPKSSFMCMPMWIQYRLKVWDHH